MLRKLSIILIFMVLSTKLIAQNMVPSAILQKVFLIKYNNSIATCFLLSIESKDYLITAKHLFPSSIKSKTPIDIEILKSNGWLKFKPTFLSHSNLNIDIAVLDMNSNDQNECSFDIGSKNYYLSQDCFFLGFPFGLKMDDNQSINNGFPLPFVKKGIISSFITDSMKMTQIFLDGHNNPGFSGGPVVITNMGQGNKYKMRIIGVVSAYLNEEKIINTPLGNFKNSENSGIVLCYAIDHVFEIIEQNKK